MSVTSHLHTKNTWHSRLNTFAAVLFVTLLVGSLIVVLNHGHQNSSGVSKNISTAQPLTKTTPTPFPSLAVPQGWHVLAQLSNSGTTVTSQNFVPTLSWQALLTCQGPGKVYAQFILGSAYTTSEASSYGLPPQITYTFSCDAPFGTQLFPPSTSKNSVQVQVTADNQITWRMLIMGCASGDAACKVASATN